MCKIIVAILLFSSVTLATTPSNVQQAQEYAIKAAYRQSGIETQMNNYIASQIKNIKYYRTFERIFTIYNIIYEKRVVFIYEF